jgi:hypothetical protein
MAAPRLRIFKVVWRNQMSQINRKFFFEEVRGRLFDGRFKQSQVNGLTGLLDYWEAQHSDKDDRWLA